MIPSRPREVNERGVSGASAQVSGNACIAAADVDDPPPARGLHVGDRGAGTAQRTQVLDVEIMEKVIVDNRVDAPDRGRRPTGMGPAVDQDVQTAERFDGPFHHPVDIVSLRHVAGERHDLATRLAGDLSRRRFEVPDISRNERHVDALAGERFRDRLADPAGPARHDCRLALQPKVHGLPSENESAFLHPGCRYDNAIPDPDYVQSSGRERGRRRGGAPGRWFQLARLRVLVRLSACAADTTTCRNLVTTSPDNRLGLSSSDSLHRPLDPPATQANPSWCLGRGKRPDTTTRAATLGYTPDRNREAP